MAQPTTEPTTEATTTTWADGPYTLIPSPLPNGQKGYKDQTNTHYAYIIAHEMSHLHNMMLRGLNAIWQQAPYISSEKDIKDFMQFCSIWHEQIHHHHHVEESFMFPQLEALLGKPGCMDANVEQHKAFEIGLEKFKVHCDAVTPTSYSAGALRAVIASFGHIFREHLGDEIPTLLALESEDSAKLKALWKKCGDYAKSHQPDNVALPYLVGTYDVNFEGGAFSEFGLPTPVYWLNEWIFARKYANAWRFLPCDNRSRPRALPFVPQEA